MPAIGETLISILQSLVYRVKRAVHHRPTLYRLVYFLSTFNLDYLGCLLRRGDFPSRFGGLWTDLPDAEEKIAARQRAKTITNSEHRCLQQFRQQGYYIVENALPGELIDEYLRELSALQQQADTPLLITAADINEPRPFTSEAFARHTSIRTVDDYFFLPAARKLLFHPTIQRQLTLLLGRQPLLTQSLNFVHGSQQHMHQDTAFVRMNSPMKLIGVWIALEDIQEDSGELIYFPGSHRWPDFLFSGHFKHYDEERDGLEQLQQWYAWLYQQAGERHTEVAKFRPRKGDVLLWHAGLCHGGDRVTGENRTRRSLVAHYCPAGVRPLYHYYKPDQRKIYPEGEHRYTTSYYR